MALRRFIQVIGALILLSGLTIAGLLVVGFVKTWWHSPESWWAFFLSALLLGGLSCIPILVGLRLLFRWDVGAIEEYAFIQAIFTGIAAGSICYYFYPKPESHCVGVIVFLVMVRVFKSLLLRVVDLPRPHSRAAVIS